MNASEVAALATINITITSAKLGHGVPYTLYRLAYRNTTLLEQISAFGGSDVIKASENAVTAGKMPAGILDKVRKIVTPTTPPESRRPGANTRRES